MIGLFMLLTTLAFIALSVALLAVGVGLLVFGNNDVVVIAVAIYLVTNSPLAIVTLYKVYKRMRP